MTRNKTGIIKIEMPKVMPLTRIPTNIPTLALKMTRSVILVTFRPKRGRTYFNLSKRYKRPSREEFRALWDRAFFYSDISRPCSDILITARIQVLKNTAVDLGFDQDMLISYQSSLREKNEFVLIA